MQHEEALAFLQEHQPLSGNAEQSMLDRYKDVMKHFFDNPDPSCLPLILGSAGLFEDLTLYDCIHAVLQRYEATDVIPHLIKACGSPYPSVRFAAADVALSYPDPRLIEPLAELLKDSTAIIRLAGASALEQIGGSQVETLARSLAKTETDEDILDVLDSILAVPH